MFSVGATLIPAWAGFNPLHPIRPEILCAISSYIHYIGVF